MSDATTKEGHVNYDISDVLVEVRAAPTMERGCYGWVAAQHAHREGSWEGGGSLVDACGSVVPCGGHVVSP